MTFTTEEEAKFRDHTIEEIRRRAWGAAMNADFLQTKVNEWRNAITFLDNEILDCEEEQSKIKASPDHHTVESRQRVKELQSKIDRNNNDIESFEKKIMADGNQVTQLLMQADTNLQMAEFAVTFSTERMDKAVEKLAEKNGEEVTEESA